MGSEAKLDACLGWSRINVVAVPQVLSRSPIIEALVDIRAEVAQPISVLQALAEELKAEFPKAHESRIVKAELKVEGGRLVAPQAHDLGLQGFQLFNADDSLAVQFKLDGLTVNNMKAYIGGEQLIDRTVALWRVFATRAQITSTSRIAMRYINKLELPFAPGDDFRRFLTTSPVLPDEVPRNFSEFLTRVIAHEDASDGPAIVITQSLVHTGDKPAVVIDLEAIKAGDFSANPDFLAGVLQELRALAKRVFFSMITEETARLYS